MTAEPTGYFGSESSEQPPRAGWPSGRTLTITLIVVNTLATIHVVWFYVYCVISYMDISRYEVGMERMPFQARLLMQMPLRFAHSSPFFIFLAKVLSWTTTWLPRYASPEDVMEAAVGLIGVAAAGLVARDMYRRRSRTRLLSAFVYPIALLMVACSYCLVSSAFFRYVYDLPSLGLFSLGLYVIYRKYSPILFAAVFVVATINRETSLFLLYFFVTSACVVDNRVVWRRALQFRTAATTILLAAFWLGWSFWVSHHFAGRPTERLNRIAPNIVTLFFPFVWPQLAGVAAYTLPFLVLFRKRIHDQELRLWFNVLPLWFAFMFRFGLLVEIRLYGELIPILACCTALLAEDYLIAAVSRHTAPEEASAIPVSS